MIAFPSMLVKPAEEAGMQIPSQSSISDWSYDPNNFPHWHVFCMMQLGASMPTPTAHWDNAKIIAAIPEDQIRTQKVTDLLARGLHIST